MAAKDSNGNQEAGRMIQFTEVEREALQGANERVIAARAKQLRITRTILEAHGVKRDEQLVAEDEEAGLFRVQPRAKQGGSSPDQPPPTPPNEDGTEPKPGE